MTKTIIQLAVVLLMTGPLNLAGQVIVGGETPDPSALLDVRSTDQGVLLPRLTTVQRDAIPNPATGLTIFNSTSNCLEANLGTSSAPVWERMKCRTGAISVLDCSGAVLTGSLQPGQTAAGVSITVPYSGGNGGVYESQSVVSTGVSGLTANLSIGNFAGGSGSLSYAITGTPAGAGTAGFALNIGGQTCALNVFLCTTGCCAKISATEYKNFMCYNLGAANTSADPFTPTWEINGGYWQWGRLTEAAPGPTATDPKAGIVSNWNTTDASNGSWADGSKTSNDPCPTGYRIPTKAELDGVVANNAKSSTGTFLNSATNYSAGKKFGNQLMLPAAGYRSAANGVLSGRGSVGDYWSSTEGVTGDSWNTLFTVNNTFFYNNYIRAQGKSVRCVAE